MDLFLGIVAEFVLQIIGQVLTDVLAIRKTKIVGLVEGSVFGAVFAIALAGITIAFHPSPLIREPGVRLAAMLLIPPANGMAVAWIGRRRATAGRLRSGFEYFVPAFTFSLVFGATRFFAQQ